MPENSTELYIDISIVGKNCTYLFIYIMLIIYLFIYPGKGFI